MVTRDAGERVLFDLALYAGFFCDLVDEDQCECTFFSESYFDRLYRERDYKRKGLSLTQVELGL